MFWCCHTSLVKKTFCSTSQLVKKYYLHTSNVIPSSEATNSLPSGLCAIYKPKGWSSSDAVQCIKHMLQNEVRNDHERPWIKVGHGGTLDPLAEGVLVLGIGDGTKLMSGFLSGGKGYHASALLGQDMDTQDSTGAVVHSIDCDHITGDQIMSSLSAFRGDILQTPPMYSALKRDGHRLYDLARKGLVVDREARPVTVYKLELCANPILPSFELEIECSGGFYVRTLIEDLAHAMGGAAHMTDLVRTKQGVFEIEDCLTNDQWTYTAIRSHINKCSLKAGLDITSLRPAWQREAYSRSDVVQKKKPPINNRPYSNKQK